jgi:hypothetical protein
MKYVIGHLRSRDNDIMCSLIHHIAELFYDLLDGLTSEKYS